MFRIIFLVISFFAFSFVTYAQKKSFSQSSMCADINLFNFGPTLEDGRVLYSVFWKGQPGAQHYGTCGFSAVSNIFMEEGSGVLTSLISIRNQSSEILSKRILKMENNSSQPTEFLDGTYTDEFPTLFSDINSRGVCLPQKVWSHYFSKDDGDFNLADFESKLASIFDDVTMAYWTCITPGTTGEGACLDEDGMEDKFTDIKWKLKLNSCLNCIVRNLSNDESKKIFSDDQNSSAKVVDRISAYFTSIRLSGLAQLFKSKNLINESLYPVMQFALGDSLCAPSNAYVRRGTQTQLVQNGFQTYFANFKDTIQYYFFEMNFYPAQYSEKSIWANPLLVTIKVPNPDGTEEHSYRHALNIVGTTSDCRIRIHDTNPCSDYMQKILRQTSAQIDPIQPANRQGCNWILSSDEFDPYIQIMYRFETKYQTAN